MLPCLRRNTGLLLATLSLGLSSLLLASVPSDWKTRSEEHTSELQSQSNVVCRLLLEKTELHTVARFGEGLIVAHEQGPVRELPVLAGLESEHRFGRGDPRRRPLRQPSPLLLRGRRGE